MLAIADDWFPDWAKCHGGLPMLGSPSSQGAIVERRISPALLLPALTDSWREAAEWSEDFWSRAMVDTRHSAEFGEIAREAERRFLGGCSRRGRVSMRGETGAVGGRNGISTVVLSYLMDCAPGGIARPFFREASR